MKKALYILTLVSCSLFISFNFPFQQSAHGNINMLKKSALLVRLKTSELAIATYKNNGDNKQAEEVRARQAALNKEIVNAFKNNFTFCKVYFFYSNNSGDINKGLFKSNLMNTSFANDTTFNGGFYLIGEFDESETTHIEAFIIKDKDSKQLTSPFPFMVKSNKSLVTERKKDEIVKELNTKLNDFWAKSN